jgi:hypothetical protein
MLFCLLIFQTMYPGLLHTHSLLRYFILIMLVVVVATAVVKWLQRKPFTSWDNKVSLYLLIFTHLQLLVGLALYAISPNVQFNAYTMKERMLRYWTVEHITLMLLVVALVTVSRISLKKTEDDRLKHQRTWLYNGMALLFALLSLSMSGRGILHPDLL